jgi:hypothetical protein
MHARIEIACVRRSRWWSVHPGLVAVWPFTSAQRCYMKNVQRSVSAGGIVVKPFLNASSGRRARSMWQVFRKPATQPVPQLCEVFWQPLPRATSGPWMERLC